MLDKAATEERCGQSWVEKGDHVEMLKCWRSPTKRCSPRARLPGGPRTDVDLALSRMADLGAISKEAAMPPPLLALYPACRASQVPGNIFQTYGSPG
jgi:hypothetical protein